MLLLAQLAAAVASQASTPASVPVVRQARASVRIVAGERISADKIPEAAMVREKQVRNADGSRTPTWLVEFP